MSELIKKSGNFQSTDMCHSINYYIIAPSSPPRAILQFCHGMAEHCKRYEKFGEFLAENGILFCIHDHLGHGGSVNSDDELGFFGSKSGWKYLPSDAAKLTHIIKKDYPDTPYFIGGHSMGSFVARAYLSINSGLVNGGIIMGGGDSTPLIAAGGPTARAVALIKGEMYRSKKLDDMSFGKYNDSIADAKTPSDWLSRDENEVKKYIDDSHCGFIFTAAAFADVTKLIGFVSSKKWADSLDKQCPLLLISGAADPVGNYGEGVTAIGEKLKATGVRDVKLKLYDGARHEILNEINREEVYTDILNWLNSKMK